MKNVMYSILVYSSKDSSNTNIKINNDDANDNQIVLCYNNSNVNNINHTGTDQQN